MTITEIVESESEPAQTLENKVIDIDGVKTHFVSSENLDNIKSYKGFNEVESFFEGYWDLFLKEYNVKGISNHCFETMHKHKLSDRGSQKCYEDTHFMGLFDLKGNALFFQKYNGNIIVLREVGKIQTEEEDEKGHKIKYDGGEFLVTDFKKDSDLKGNIYIEETTKSRLFKNKKNINKARLNALYYMQDIVDYHDAQGCIKCLDGVDVDPNDSSRFSISGDLHKFEFPFDYHDRSDISDFQKIHEREVEELNERKEEFSPKLVDKLKNILRINEGCCEAAEKPYRVTHYA